MFRYIPKNLNYTRNVYNTYNVYLQHEMAAFNSMVFRLINILMNRIHFNKELEVIKQIASFIRYDDDMISKLVQM